MAGDTPKLPSQGHLLAREQIAIHGSDRYPDVAAQYGKLLEEAGDLGTALIAYSAHVDLDRLEDHNITAPVIRRRSEIADELADTALALYSLAGALGLDIIEEMERRLGLAREDNPTPDQIAREIHRLGGM